MRILTVHKFHYIEGGAERYLFNQTRLLEGKGHAVIPFSMHHPRNQHSAYQGYFAEHFNPEQLREVQYKPWALAQRVARVCYNRNAQQQLDRLIRDVQPDLAHVHSIYHHLSPAVLHTLKAHRLPVVMELHDYKLICPNYILLDGQGHLCEACRGHRFFRAFWKKCFRNSYPASLLVAVEASLHKWLKSYHRHIDLFISPSRFLADKMKQYGFGDKTIVVQPYTLDVASYVPYYGPSDYFIFMGRLTHEKGVRFLLEAAEKIRNSQLYICGTGPMEEELRQIARQRRLDHVRFMGYQSGEALKELVAKARFTVVTSEWHDNSPLVIYESLSLGKAVIGSRLGGIPELIEEGVDGFTYQAGDLQDFVAKVQRLIDNPDKAIAMGQKARAKAERFFAPEPHYQRLMQLYQQAQSLNAGTT
jgi:glycosyltransferase involved in cell wall biosynthesis